MFKKVIRVQTDSENRLVIEHATRFVLDGKWDLTDEGALKFRVLTKDSYLAGKDIIFRGEIEETGGDFLRFRIRHCEPVSGIKSGSIELKGRWQADKDNRICFSAARGEGRYDTLRFQGAWDIGKNNELIYRYKKTYLKTKTNQMHTVVFKGAWELGKNKLVYRLDKSTDSFFAFKAVLESTKLSSSSSGIKYKVGLRYEEKSVYRNIRKTVTISGKWKIRKDFKIGFEVSYPGRKKSEFTFMAEKLFAKGDSVGITLKTETGESLGLEVTFKDAFADDGELFLALSRYGEESKIVGGLTVKF